MSNLKKEEEEFYNVEEIIDKKRVGRTHHYLVKWEGYSRKNATWEPKRHLLRVRHMVLEFEKRLRNGEIRLGESQDDEVVKTVRKRKKRKNKIPVNLKVFEEEINEKSKIEKKETIPLKVLSASKEKENEIYFLVEFSNGDKINLPHSEMRNKYPLLLCNFYESKMIVIKSNNKEDIEKINK